MVELCVVVDRKLHPKSDDIEPVQWYILMTDHGVVKGTVQWLPKKGERLKLQGRWGTYKGSRQFEFDVAIPDIPVTSRDQLHYVCETTCGIGPSLEKAIYEQWGDDWIECTEPDVLPRLSGELYSTFRDRISEVLREKEKSEIIAWMLTCGATTNLAAAAWEKWKTATVGVVTNDCYRLAELENRGFNDVDKLIRFHFNITDGDPRRISAAISYTINKLCDDGSTVVEWERLYHEVAGLVGYQYQDVIIASVAEMFSSKRLIAFPSACMSTARDYNNELSIWSFVA